MSWLTIVQAIATFITGQFGLLLITVAIGIAGGEAAIYGRWGRFFSSIAGGAVLVSSAWAVNTFMGG